MARVSTYLNFLGNTEEAFTFYESVFGTKITSLDRMSSMPTMPGGPELSENEKNMIMNVQLPILGGHMIMGTDIIESMGHILTIGNNTTINLESDTRAEVDKLYAALSESGDSTQCMAPMDMPWGGYFGVCLDKFGIRWMFNYSEAKE